MEINGKECPSHTFVRARRFGRKQADRYVIVRPAGNGGVDGAVAYYAYRAKNYTGRGCREQFMMFYSDSIKFI